MSHLIEKTTDITMEEFTSKDSLLKKKVTIPFIVSETFDEIMKESNRSEEETLEFLKDTYNRCMNACPSFFGFLNASVKSMCLATENKELKKTIEEVRQGNKIVCTVNKLLDQETSKMRLDVKRLSDENERLEKKAEGLFRDLRNQVTVSCLYHRKSEELLGELHRRAYQKVDADIQRAMEMTGKPRSDVLDALDESDGDVTRACLNLDYCLDYCGVQETNK